VPDHGRQAAPAAAPPFKPLAKGAVEMAALQPHAGKKGLNASRPEISRFGTSAEGSM
jgi:hypothetical protein